MQWKQMDWPLMVDSLNLLEVTVVPVTVAIDEHGIVRHVGLRQRDAANIGELFVDKTYPAPGDSSDGESSKTGGKEAGDGGDRRRAASRDISRLKAEAIRSGTADAWRAYAEQLVLWGGERRVSEAIDAYRSAVALDADHGYTHFRLAAASRMRYDSPEGEATDFSDAIEHWSRALEIDPNNYIWRRRIQQYGPRQAKPYPFYDWVAEARDAISAREEEPLPLVVEPAGAELTSPQREFQADASEVGEPDPGGKVTRDQGRFIEVEKVVVPEKVAPGQSVRVHLEFRPNEQTGTHWNNEARELAVWIDPPEGWQVDRRRLTVPIPRERISDEPRRVEFEVQVPAGAEKGVRLPVYAVYYVCEDIDGTCLYRRHDIPVRIEVGE
ncbi:hypothetical protein ABI59_08960 [Acidobacteria bacterium Mor1]|nr:hypothetical protein ABI59_08960 [Acidobacteria bacterium Mor1]